MRAAKRWVITLFTALAISMLGTESLAMAEPSYAEWGRVAVLEAKKKYDADITDYKHIGRKPVKDHIYEEQFKLIVKKPSKEFGVYVSVQFNEDTGELLDIKYKEAAE
ncbi:DUF3889 domain-containing protein [Paenibacillus zeisoli]|uniref:DUF3889 domain-containing protein n=1 Tax=Paenibacillus zeisoli TaxID=2496267 RepID=A0A433X6A4_9BACL|nr:DUF3889 domain-containing protein [Paenibacillus zeisoli]RUT29579.1 DUF3889 domain-containing protein [Paenibacillus zeisoli]